MKQMTIKLITNFVYKGKRKEIAEEVKAMIDDPPEKKDCSKISNILKKMFEDELCRIVVVKTRIKKDSILATINIRSEIDEK